MEVILFFSDGGRREAYDDESEDEDAGGIPGAQRVQCAHQSMLAALSSCVTALRQDPQVRVVILTGAEDKAFCMGTDATERGQWTAEEVRSYARRLSATLSQLASLPQPVIAAINGAAVGSGLELALACDLRVATKTTTFCCTEVSWGLIPSAGGTQRLPRLIGMARAKEMILTARRLDAATAKKWGLVHHVVEVGEVLRYAEAWADRIAPLAPLAVRQAKRVIHGGAALPLEEALHLEQQAYEALLDTADRAEGMMAFTERRTPQYQGC